MGAHKERTSMPTTVLERAAILHIHGMMYKTGIRSSSRKPAALSCSWLPRPILSWEWNSMMSTPALLQSSWLWQRHRWAKGSPNVWINGSWYLVLQTLFCIIMAWKPGALRRNCALSFEFWCFPGLQKCGTVLHFLVGHVIVNNPAFPFKVRFALYDFPNCSVSVLSTFSPARLRPIYDDLQAVLSTHCD